MATQLILVFLIHSIKKRSWTVLHGKWCQLRYIAITLVITPPIAILCSDGGHPHGLNSCVHCWQFTQQITIPSIYSFQKEGTIVMDKKPSIILDCLVK